MITSFLAVHLHMCQFFKDILQYILDNIWCTSLSLCLPLYRLKCQSGKSNKKSFCSKIVSQTATERCAKGRCDNVKRRFRINGAFNWRWCVEMRFFYYPRHNKKSALDISRSVYTVADIKIEPLRKTIIFYGLKKKRGIWDKSRQCQIFLLYL